MVMGNTAMGNMASTARLRNPITRTKTAFGTTMMTSITSAMIVVSNC